MSTGKFLPCRIINNVGFLSYSTRKFGRNFGVPMVGIFGGVPYELGGYDYEIQGGGNKGTTPRVPKTPSTL